MNQRSVRPLALRVAIGGSLLMALFWADPATAGDPSPETSRHSVKGLKLKVALLKPLQAASARSMRSWVSTRR